jgi:hypothetical protein
MFRFYRDEARRFYEGPEENRISAEQLRDIVVGIQSISQAVVGQGLSVNYQLGRIGPFLERMEKDMDEGRHITGALPGFIREKVALTAGFVPKAKKEKKYTVSLPLSLLYMFEEIKRRKHEEPGEITDEEKQALDIQIKVWKAAFREGIQLSPQAQEVARKLVTAEDKQK